MINLNKNQSINLTKVASKGLTSLCVGLDWGMITTKEFMGFSSSQESVDLDASIIVYDKDKNILDTVYYGNRTSKGIEHSGDDTGGDAVNDDSDNEVITCDLTNVDPKATSLMVVLHSFSKQTFGEIPYVRIRVYTGKPNKPTEVLARLDLAQESSFKGKISMIMGCIEKKDAEWSFRAIGKETNDRSLNDTKNTAKSFV